jgi:O-antigen/teichoic acid export membrane protein
VNTSKKVAQVTAPESGKADPGDSPLRERSVRGGAITMASQGVAQCVHLVTVIFMARLLLPEDHGMLAMVMAVIGFAVLFKDVGLSSATIQREKLTMDQVSVLFWINAALGALIMLAVAALAPAVGWFYQDARLVPVTLALSLTYFIGGLSIQHRALLTRRLRFGALGIINVAGLLAGLAAGVAVALRGGGYWALVANILVTVTCTTLGMWLASGWIPNWRLRGAGIREMLHFGAHITGFEVVNYFARQMDRVLIGKLWGALQLGLYSKAYALLMFPTSALRVPLHQVAFPILSRLQNEPERFRAYCIKYCSILAFICMPVVTLLFLLSDQLIPYVLGTQWSGAVELFQIFAFMAFIQPVSLNGIVLMSTGQGKRYFRWGSINALGFVTAFLCGVSWGAKGVAIAYCIAYYVMFHPMMIYALRQSPVRPADFYGAISKPALVCITLGVMGWFAKQQIIGAHPLAILLLFPAFFAAAYLAAFSLMPGGRKALADYWAYLLLLLPKKRAASA